MKKYILINFLIALVWFGNGLFCKVLNLVPRHQQIVANIFGPNYASQLTKLIGFAEVGMAIWIFSGRWHRLNAITQICVIAGMNILEFVLVPDLLLWGRANVVFAFLFILLICINEYFLHPNNFKQA